MIYRALDAAGDFVFGKGAANFLVNSRAAVSQAISTRLRLSQGEWFLDTTVGVPYNTQILGAGTMTKYDAAIKDAILNTSGVTGITSYASKVDPITRRATIACAVSTIYGQVTLTQAL